MKKTVRTLLGVVLFASILLISNTAKSQQSLIQVNGWNAYVHLPSDYSTSKVYPTIIEFPGLGEVGTNASLVIEYGPGAYIAQGWNGNVTVGSNTVEFIVISLQPAAAYPAVSITNTAIASLKTLYKIDPKNLFLTGYSEGGWCASMFASSDPVGGPYTYASQVKAICTVEGVKPDDNADYPNGFTGFALTGGKDLCLEQINDGRDGQTVVTDMNNTVANSAFFYQTDFSGGGHCCWSEFYGGGGTTPTSFPVFGTTQTIYQWFASLVNPSASTTPVISSAATATGTTGTAFSYTITASNTPTSYAASGLPAGLSINTSTGVISGTPTTAGTSNVTISAINASGTGTATLAITINPPTPVISSAATATGTTGIAFSYTITASNTPTSYAATGLPAGLSVNTSTGVISGAPTTAGTSSVTISAINAGGSGAKTLTITINAAAPVISSAATATGTTGIAFSYIITASNTPTSYATSGLPAGLSVNTSTGVISGTPTTAGTSSVTISAINAGGTGAKTLTITINAAAPVISSAATATGTTGIAFSYIITASNTPTSYAATGLPAGLSVNTSTGVISGTPTTAGTSSITISAINTGGTGTKTLTITINPPAPVISSAATATGTTGIAFSYTITASNTPTSYAASGLPAGLSVNTSTGVISGTPTTAGTSNVTISAINAGGTGTKTLTITINPPAPVVSSAATATGTTGIAFSYTITASNTPTSYAATGLPAGLSVNTSTGVISGTPTTAGTSSVTISAINTGGTGTKTLTITINPPAPVISSAATATGNTDATFSYTITASNTPTSYAATGLPAGISINTTTGVISGTPTTAATSNVTISATNVGGTGTKTLTITISSSGTSSAPVILSAATASGTTGTEFNYTITISGTATSYGATGLPAGLTINTSTGIISGVPTATGTFSVTISATNTGGTGTKTLTITIKPPVPVISSAATATGSTGVAFSYTITASNTPTSYAASTLPAGLTINTSTGIISGTPTIVATSSVTISATNAGGTATKALTVTINLPAPVISSAATATGTINVAFSYTITASNTPTSYAASALPAGLTINTSTGVISGTPTAIGTSDVTISAINAGGTATATLVITINSSLVVSAGSDQVITLPINSTILSGSVTDVSGTIASYQWTKIVGPASGTITSPTSASTAVTALVAGIYEFTLTVTDNKGVIAKDTMQLKVNIAPIADAGASQVITLPTNSVTLSGSGTDVDGTVVGYLWTKVSGPMGGTITSTQSASTTVTGLTAGIYKFTLTVTDNNGATGVDTTQVTVNSATTSGKQVVTANAGNHNDLVWALTANNTVVATGPISAGTMIPGTDFPNPGTFNTEGYKSTITSGDWPTTATNGDNIDFPLVSNASIDFTINNLTLTAKTSGSSGNTLLSLAYEQDNSGTWVPFGTAQTAPSGGTTNINFGALNQALPHGHAYTIRLYIYAASATTTSSRNVYIKDVTITGKSAINITLPTDTTSLYGSGTDSGGTIAAYQWAKISGPATGTITNAASATATLTGLVQGVYGYALTVTGSNGTTAKDTIQVTVNAVAGRPADNQPNTVTTVHNGMNIYPNPVQSTLTAQISVATVDQNASIALVDVTGRVLYKNQIVITQQNTNVQIDVSQFPTGIYFLNLNVGGQTITQKVIKN